MYFHKGPKFEKRLDRAAKAEKSRAWLLAAWGQLPCRLAATYATSCAPQVIGALRLRCRPLEVRRFCVSTLRSRAVCKAIVVVF